MHTSKAKLWRSSLAIIIMTIATTRTTASAFIGRLASISRPAAASSRRAVGGTAANSLSYSIGISRAPTPTPAKSGLVSEIRGRRSFSAAVVAAAYSAAYSEGGAKAEGVTPESLLESFRENTGKTEVVGNSVADAMHALYNADAVCFDVDSTVINEEGIDVLAEYLGKGEAVAKLTAAAMEGGMKFQDALKARLDLLEPSRKQILDCLEAFPLELTPGVDGLVSSLHSAGVDVFLVSGGFRIMIEPVAKVLNIPPEANVVANTILFESDADGTYAGFDASEPTSQDMGKPKALQQIMADRGHTNVVMVGDGATDAQAKPPATAFIGFGGVVEREPVKAKADWFVTDFRDMTTIIEMRK